jgi:hypothetical protein
LGEEQQPDTQGRSIMEDVELDEEEERRLSNLANAASKRMAELSRQGQAGSALSIKLRRMPANQRLLVINFLETITNVPEVRC